MTVLEKIAFFQNQRSDAPAPNQELARQLAAAEDRAGIAEIAAALRHKNKNVRSDCIKVLYEIGYLKPALIADYTGDFLALLASKDNRMVWGTMIALAAVADLRPQQVWEKIDLVTATIQAGSVITVVWGIRTVAKVAAADSQYAQKLLPFLFSYLRTCIPRDLPTHAESMLCALSGANSASRLEFLSILAERQNELTPAQLSRLKKSIRKYGFSQ